MLAEMQLLNCTSFLFSPLSSSLRHSLRMRNFPFFSFGTDRNSHRVVSSLSLLFLKLCTVAAFSFVLSFFSVC